MVHANEVSVGSGALALPVVKKAASAVFDGSGGETPRSARRMLVAATHISIPPPGRFVVDVLKYRIVLC
ncbi:hypothetical protein [Halorhabdus utahensis]|uniref:hypothetical protein n=1 Tax=Halorhabdus utahensis TaxID=146826 RepID=UPI00145E7A20|nr:hypothetical protein [Halorhabdus utahensis]